LHDQQHRELRRELGFHVRRAVAARHHGCAAAAEAYAAVELPEEPRVFGRAREALRRARHKGRERGNA